MIKSKEDILDNVLNLAIDGFNLETYMANTMKEANVNKTYIADEVLDFLVNTSNYIVSCAAMHNKILSYLESGKRLEKGEITEITESMDSNLKAGISVDKTISGIFTAAIESDTSLDKNLENFLKDVVEFRIAEATLYQDVIAYITDIDMEEIVDKMISDILK